MGPSQGDTQASPQQKKGPALSVVKSSNHPPPHAPDRLLLLCASPPSLSTPSNSERRAGAPPTHVLCPPAHPGQREAGWGSGVHFGVSPSLRVLHLVILNSFWNFPYVFPVIFSLSRGSHQSLNSKGRGREWSVPFGLSVHLRANPGSRRQRSGPQVLAPEAQVSDPWESRPLLLLALASRGSVASSLRWPASFLPGQ